MSHEPSEGPGQVITEAEQVRGNLRDELADQPSNSVVGDPPPSPSGEHLLTILRAVPRDKVLDFFPQVEFTARWRTALSHSSNLQLPKGCTKHAGQKHAIALLPVASQLWAASHKIDIICTKSPGS